MGCRCGIDDKIIRILWVSGWGSLGHRGCCLLRWIQRLTRLRRGRQLPIVWFIWIHHAYGTGLQRSQSSNDNSLVFDLFLKGLLLASCCVFPDTYT